MLLLPYARAATLIGADAGLNAVPLHVLHLSPAGTVYELNAYLPSR